MLYIPDFKVRERERCFKKHLWALHGDHKHNVEVSVFIYNANTLVRTQLVSTGGAPSEAAPSQPVLRPPAASHNDECSLINAAFIHLSKYGKNVGRKYENPRPLEC